MFGNGTKVKIPFESKPLLRIGVRSIYLDLIEAVFCCHQRDPNDGGWLKL